jgi:phage I-like protein
MNYIDPASGADLGPKLLSVGMVNRPFFQELTPLAAKDKERIPMDEKTLKALGLAKDATPEQIAAAIKANADKLAETEQAKKDAETALAEAQKTLDELNANKDEPEPEALTDAVRSEFDLPEGATTIDLKAAKLKLSMGSPDLAKDVAEIKARLANEETAVLVAKYVKEGKITKGMLADATALAKASPELFVKTFDNAPALNLATEVVNGAAPVTDPEKYELTSDDKFVAKQLGLTDEEFSKSAVTLNARLTE